MDDLNLGHDGPAELNRRPGDERRPHRLRRARARGVGLSSQRQNGSRPGRRGQRRDSGDERRVPTRWLFVCIGVEPQTHWAEALGIVRDEAGYLVTGPDLTRHGARPPSWPLDREPYFLETSIPGVLAAGDVRRSAVRRCASAVGEGAMEVAFVHRVLDGC